MAETTTRHPLNLPPGSIRSMLALMISGLFVALLVLPGTQNVPVPTFLYLLLTLIMVFVVAHGKTIAPEGERPPLHLPRGTVPFLISVGLIAAVVWKFVNDQDALIARLQPSTDQLKTWPVLLCALFGGFFIGRILKRGPWNNSAMFQDMLAWVSLLCMIGLGIESLGVLFVHQAVGEGINLHKLEAFLTGAVALYFGARC